MNRLLAHSLCAVLAASISLRAEEPPPPMPEPIPPAGGEVDEKKIGELIEKLGSSDWDERAAAAKELEAIGKPAADALKKAMDSADDPEVKVSAKRLLQKMGALQAAEMTDESFDEMLELLRSQDGVAWYSSSPKPYFYLYQLNEKPEWSEALKGKALAPRLAKALGDESGNLKRNVCYLLAEMVAPEVAPQIAKLLKDEEMMTRAIAAYSLGKLGNPEVVDQVIVALSDGEKQVQRAAAMALETLPSASAIEPLLGAMASEDPHLRFQAYYSLRSLTGQKFRFNAFMGPDSRKDSLKVIEEWWGKNKAGFKPQMPPKREEVGKNPGAERVIEVTPK
ncbi:MAG: PBS lyase HEAT domain-containing protein repeat-containing [Planctomycetota bacterium]|nr:MAG: PBS lyase HEAT domain-containing protein repeat-containing [Planctomycetota bacterium]